MNSLQRRRPLPLSVRLAIARAAAEAKSSRPEEYTMTISYRVPWEVRATLATARFFAWLATFLRQEAMMCLESRRREGTDEPIRVYVNRARY